MKCATCGADNPAGGRFCSACGASITAGPGSGRPPTAPAAGGGPKPPGSKTSIGHMASILWIAIPTVIYGYLARDLVLIVGLTVFGALLKIAEGRREIPTVLRPFLRYLQSVAAYVLLGGSIFPVIVAAVLGFFAVKNVKTLVPALEPWWRIQQGWSRGVRMVLGVAVTFLVGYVCGSSANGSEWTMTFVSMLSGTVMMFLFTFDPPAGTRRAEPERVAPRLN